MPSRLLPLFPLRVVVFPRTRLPLHIFEPRYKEMVGESLRNQSEFGVVLAKENGIVNAGCTVSIEKVVKNYPDGRMDIITKGSRRFEILMLDEQKDYLRGEVEYFDDDAGEPAPADLRLKILNQYQELVEMGATQDWPEPDLEDPQLSFQLAQSLEDLDFLSVLLRTRSENERLRELNQFLSEYLPRQRHTVHMKQIAPQNGFGGKPAGVQ